MKESSMRLAIATGTMEYASTGISIVVVVLEGARGVHMRKDTKPVVSYVVLTRNSEKTVRQCLQSIQAQEGSKEIIIIDGNSSDRTLQVVTKFDVKVVILHDDNIATARNKGVGFARGRFIAFIDSDVTLPLNWTSVVMRILLSTNTEGEIAGVSSRYMPAELSAVSHNICESENLHPGTKFVDYLYFQSSIFHANILKRFSFNPQWKRSGEDVDMSFQLREAGYFLIHTDETSVYHYSPASMLGMMKRYFCYGINFSQVLFRHSTFLTEKHAFWFMYLPICMVFMFNVLWQLVVFFAPYVMHGYRFWNAWKQFSLAFAVVNGIKFQVHAIGIFIGLVLYVLKGRSGNRCQGQ